MRSLAGSLVIVSVALATAATAAPADYTIDAAQSKIEVHTKKAGLLSRLGHTHHILATRLEGTVHADAEKIDASKLDLTVQAPSLTVADTGLSQKDRNAVQSNMQGAQVLDVARFPTIRFRTESVNGEAAGPSTWTVVLTGPLSLHGVEKPLKLKTDVVVDGDRLTATGEVKLSQREFGIKPFRAALGAVGVADGVTVTFRIVAHKRAAAH